MTTIERNDDIRHDSTEEPYQIPPELIPPGCYVSYGKFQMLTARQCKPPVPFGLVERRRPCSNSSRIETLGLVIRLSDRKRFEAALESKDKRVAYESQLPSRAG